MDPRPAAPPVVAVVVVSDPGPWLEETLSALGAQDYPELSVLVLDAANRTDPEVGRVLPGAHYRRLAEPVPWAAAFLAGKCFLEYRRRGGSKRSPLPDFFIGAHAAVKGYDLLTRDATRYRTYFPTVKLIAPGWVTG